MDSLISVHLISTNLQDLIVFPDDTEFKKIPQCTTGRVYVLKFKDSKKLFLWLQVHASEYY